MSHTILLNTICTTWVVVVGGIHLTLAPVITKFILHCGSKIRARIRIQQKPQKHSFFMTVKQNTEILEVEEKSKTCNWIWKNRKETILSTHFWRRNKLDRRRMGLLCLTHRITLSELRPMNEFLSIVRILILSWISLKNKIQYKLHLFACL